MRPSSEGSGPLGDRALGDLASIGSFLAQEIEHARVHDPMLADTHVVTGPWHQFALDIRKQPARPRQCRHRIAHDLVVAHH